MIRMLAPLQRWYPKRLTSQMIGLLLGALVIAQVANFLIFMDERRAEIREGGAVRVLLHTALEHVDNGSEGAGIDLVGDSRGIVFQPRIVH